MPISDDAIMALARNVGEMTGKVGELTDVMKTHLVDPQAHSGVIPRVTSLETTRKFFRRSLIAGAVTTPVAGAAQMGWVGKLLAIVKAGVAVGGGQ